MIDLRSDTVTKPNELFLKEVLNAELGDDEYGEDPTVNKLQDKCAEIFGFEDALFVTSGLMGNQISLMIHNKPGTEVITSSDSHIKNYEHGAASFLSRVQFREVNHIDGNLDLNEVNTKYAKSKVHKPIISSIAIENTHLASGGSIINYEDIKKLYDYASQKGLKLHIDGARIWHAILESNSSCNYGSVSDSLTFCFSKGLGAPIGSMLMGNKQFISEARKYRKILGGGMRQVGVLASIANKALDSRDELLNDHIKAREVFNKIEKKDVFMDLVYKNTNMIIMKFFSSEKANNFITTLKKHQILSGLIDDVSVRLVFHKDINTEEISKISDAINYSSSEV